MRSIGNFDEGHKFTYKTLASDEKNVILNIVHIHLSRNPNVVCLIGKAIPSLSRVSFPGAI